MSPIDSNPTDLGHRFAGDPDEAPRCVYCDARAGGTAAAELCDRLADQIVEAGPFPEPTWKPLLPEWPNPGAIEGPGD